MKSVIKIKFVFFAAAIILFFSPSGFSAEDPSLSHTLLPAPRANTLGAYSAAALDIESLYYNIGGLAMVPQSELSFFYADNLGFIKQYSLSYSHKFTKSALALGINYLKHDTAAFNAETPVPYEKYGAADYSVTLGYSYAFTRLFSAGASVKYFHSQKKEEKANAAGFDIGLRYKFDALPIYASLVFQNIGSTLKYTDESEYLPLTYRFGVYYDVFRNQRLNLALDFKKTKGRAFGVALGAEFAVWNTLMFRAGYDTRRFHSDMKKWSLGLGAEYKGAVFNYSFTPATKFKNQHSFSIGYKFAPRSMPGAPRRGPARVYNADPHAPPAPTSEAEEKDDSEYIMEIMRIREELRRIQEAREGDEGKKEKAVKEPQTDAAKRSLSLQREALENFSDGKTETALNQLKTAYNLTPDNYEIPYNIATIYYRLNDYERAAQFYETVLKINPSNLDSYIYAGNSYYRLNEFNKAMAMWTDALSIDPDNDMLKRNVLTLMESGR